MQLKVFATQEAASSSDSEYVVRSNAESLAYATFYFPTLVLLGLTYLLYARLLPTDAASRYLQKIATAKKPYYQLFRSVYFVTASFCAIYLLLEVTGLYIGISNPSAWGAIGSKFGCFLLFCFVITLIPAYIIGKYSTSLTNDQLPSIKKRIKLFLAAWNFLIFTSIITWSIIPILILALVNPIQTLAVVLLSFSVFLLVCSLLAIYSLALWGTTEQLEEKKLQKYCKNCLNLLVALALSIPLLFTVALAVEFLDKGASTGGLLGVIIAFIPGAITGIAVWFSKKILARYEDKEGGSPAETDQDNDQNPLSDDKKDSNQSTA